MRENRKPRRKLISSSLHCKLLCYNNKQKVLYNSITASPLLRCFRRFANAFFFYYNCTGSKQMLYFYFSPMLLLTSDYIPFASWTFFHSISVAKITEAVLRHWSRATFCQLRVYLIFSVRLWNFLSLRFFVRLYNAYLLWMDSLLFIFFLSFIPAEIVFTVAEKVPSGYIGHCALCWVKFFF